MTVDDVVKGLKLCSSRGRMSDICPGCPYYGLDSCVGRLKQDAASIILQGEIDKQEKEMSDISIPELRVLAEKLGYKLVPIKRYERFIPCICGCNRRTTWFVSNNSRFSVRLECKRCGLKVDGKNEADAKHNWNKLIQEKEKDNDK